jgi:hypothetical protein
MPLLRLAQPFDHPDWLFEVKHDGFRALAHIDGHHCHLVSRNGHTFKHWPQLCELAHATKAHNAVIDGEIVCASIGAAAAISRICCFGETGRSSTPSTCWRLMGKTCASGRSSSASGDCAS